MYGKGFREFLATTMPLFWVLSSQKYVKLLQGLCHPYYLASHPVPTYVNIKLLRNVIGVSGESGLQRHSAYMGERNTIHFLSFPKVSLSIW